MDIDRLADLLLAGGLAGLIAAMVMALEKRRAAARDDRKQAVDEKATSATAADTIAKAATSVVALQDAQVEELKALIESQRQEFQRRLDAQGAEIAAYDTRFDIQVQKFLHAEAARMVLEEQVNRLRDELARMGAQFELADTERKRLQNENGAMKTKMYEMAVGVQTLTRQLREVKVEPMYSLDVPVTATGRLGPIDVEAVRQFGS